MGEQTAKKNKSFCNFLIGPTHGAEPSLRLGRRAEIASAGVGVLWLHIPTPARVGKQPCIQQDGSSA